MIQLIAIGVLALGVVTFIGGTLYKYNSGEPTAVALVLGEAMTAITTEPPG